MKISEVLGKCQVCDHQKKAPWKPVVSYPLATDFNELVCMDLHQLGPNLWYLHCICAFSHFSLAISVSSKDANVVISKYIKCWVSIFGPPSRAILSDNGGEFCNEKFQEFAESFNLEVKTTGSHSPFSNGICERHNALLTDTLEKVTQDHPEIDLDTRLAYACMAKNNLSNVSGFSPYQVVLGINPNIRSNITSRIVSLGIEPSFSSVSKHLAALQDARLAFLKADNDERVKRALRHNVRSSGSPFNYGDVVFYKRSIDARWHGPARVVGVDGKVIFVRHGSSLHRLHETDLLHDDTTKSMAFDSMITFVLRIDLTEL